MAQRMRVKRAPGGVGEVFDIPLLSDKTLNETTGNKRVKGILGDAVQT